MTDTTTAMNVRLSKAQRSVLSEIAAAPNGFKQAYNGASSTYYALQDKGMIVLEAKDPITVYARITAAGRAILEPRK